LVPSWAAAEWARSGARDELLARDVAVKEITLPPEMQDDEQEAGRDRAVREAQMAARLRHPNVVGVFDIVEDDGRPVIVMEFVPAGPQPPRPVPARRWRSAAGAVRRRLWPFGQGFVTCLPGSVIIAYRPDRGQAAEVR
jgi:hypothetical protein